MQRFVIIQHPLAARAQDPRAAANTKRAAPAPAAREAKKPKFSADSRRDALAALLKDCLGAPVPSEQWTPTSPRLRELPPPCGARTACDALYWYPLPSAVAAEVAAAEAAARARGAKAGKDAATVARMGVLAMRRAIKGWGDTQPWFASLTIESEAPPMGPAPPALEVWHASRTAIGVPRYWGLSQWGPPAVDRRTQGEAMRPLTLDASRPPKPEQDEGFVAVIATMDEWGGAFLVAGCGMGKTVSAMRIALHYGRKTAIVTNRGHLARQWQHAIAGKCETWADDGDALRDADVPEAMRSADRATWVRARCKKKQRKEDGGTIGCGRASYAIEGAERDACGCGAPLDFWVPTVDAVRAWVPGARVGRMQGPWNAGGTRREAAHDAAGRTDAKPLAHQADTRPCDIDGADFVLISAQSLVQCGYPRHLREQFGLLIVDEAHFLGGATLSQITALFPNARTLCLSATPERRDGREKLLYWSGGPAAYCWERVPAITGEAGGIDVTQVHCAAGVKPVYFPFGKGMLNASETLAALDAHAGRTAAQLAAITALLADRAMVMVATDTQERANFLFGRLVPAVVPRRHAFLLHSAAESLEAAAAASRGKRARLVVATFDYVQEGYDAERMDALVLLSPQSRVKQALGRLQRTHAGKKRPRALDWVDTDVPQYVGQARKRRREYEHADFTVTDEKCAL